jgi:hypothetical protein
MGKMQQFKREIRSAVGKQLAFDVRSGYGAALSGLFERIGRGHKVYDSEIREMMTGRSEVGITQFIDAGDATKGKLAKLAAFVSQSISSTSQALGTGGPSQAIAATV